MMLGLIVLVAALASVSASPKPEISNVRFGGSRLMLCKAKTGSTAYVRGPLRVDMSFKKAQVRKPLLRIACLCEANGELVCCSGLWDRLNTNSRLARSEVSQAFKRAGIEPPPKDRAKAYADPRMISPLLGEALREQYVAASYGDKTENGGFFRISAVSGIPRLLLCRFELWQNGTLVGFSESSRTGLGKYDIPEDWHEWRKYPLKFKYQDSP